MTDTTRGRAAMTVQDLRALAMLRLFAECRIKHRFWWCPDAEVHKIRVIGCTVCDALSVSDRWGGAA